MVVMMTNSFGLCVSLMAARTQRATYCVIIPFTRDGNVGRDMEMKTQYIYQTDKPGVGWDNNNTGTQWVMLVIRMYIFVDDTSYRTVNREKNYLFQKDHRWKESGKD